MKEVMRSYCITVLLGNPPRHTFAVLLKARKRASVLWLTDRAPLYAKLMGVAALKLPVGSTSLERELCHIAEQYEGKMLTLLPVTEGMKNFIKENRGLLEQSYRICLD